MRIWSLSLGLLGHLGTWNNFQKVDCALAPPRTKRSYENGYYFYIPADRGCFDQLPACPKFTCEHEQLRLGSIFFKLFISGVKNQDIPRLNTGYFLIFYFESKIMKIISRLTLRLSVKFWKLSVILGIFLLQ